MTVSKIRIKRRRARRRHRGVSTSSKKHLNPRVQLIKPEWKVPESKVPEPKVPEPKVPEPKVPEPKVPEPESQQVVVNSDRKVYLFMTVLKGAICLLTILLIILSQNYNSSRPLKFPHRQGPGGEVILLWNSDFLGLNSWEYQQCGCIVTNNRNYANGLIRAIVFNADEPYTLAGLDQVRRSADYLAVFSARNPLSLAQNPLLDNSHNVYNLTMTYRRDSDIFLTDYYIMPITQNAQNRARPELKSNELNLKLKLKNRLIFYMLYEVNDFSLQESLYLQKLRKFMELDGYITCNGDNDCSQYKFMLIFEPSGCPDYVHAQFYKALAHYVVPVLIGGGNYSKLVPPDCYVNSADFASPLRLAEYLTEVSRVPELYEKFFTWHTQYRIERNMYPYCALCRQIHQAQEAHEPEKFLKWWTGYQCPSGGDALANSDISTNFLHSFNYRSRWGD